MVDISQTRTERQVLNDVYDNNKNAVNINNIFSLQTIVLGTANTSYVLGSNAVLNSVFVTGLSTGETDTLTVQDVSGNTIQTFSTSGVYNLYLGSGYKLLYSYSGVTTATGKVIVSLVV